MKKLLVTSVLFVVTVSFLWSAGQQQAAAVETMDEIVYLSAENHDAEQAVRDAWAAEFERITGVKVVLKTVSSKDANDSMLAQFMAGEFPDVAKYGTENLNALARQEFIIPLDPYIEKSPGMSKLKTMYPTAFTAHSVGGEVYGIPAEVGAKRALWVRTDVPNSLGLDMPTTLDELVGVMKKMRDGYPTPEGTKMSPLITKTYHHGYIAAIGNYFNVSIDPAIRRPLEGSFREGWDTPQFRDYAEFVKMLYDEQLMDPDHVLPQKASGTRTKLYAGKGAFIIMWAHNYQAMVTGLRENFTDAELDIVPPIVNPNGGVLGLSVVPGYRPFVITKDAASPAFVFEKFIETIYLTVDGALLQTRGVPNVNYRVENGVMVDNSDVSGVGMGLRSPFNPAIKFPYAMEPLTQKGSEIESKYDSYFSKYGDYIVADEPSAVVPDFDLIYDDMKDKKNEVFWKYVLGELSFDEMMSQFEAYKKEINFDAILKQINEAS